MAEVIVTLKIMPESPETDLEKIKEQADIFIKEFGGEVGKVEIVPIAFGLKAMNMVFVMEENLGSTEALEEKVSGIKGVNSVEVTDVRRALG